MFFQVVNFSVEEGGVHQEAAIGLAAKIFKFMSKLDFNFGFEE